MRIYSQLIERTLIGRAYCDLTRSTKVREQYHEFKSGLYHLNDFMQDQDVNVNGSFYRLDASDLGADDDAKQQALPIVRVPCIKVLRVLKLDPVDYGRQLMKLLEN